MMSCSVWFSPSFSHARVSFYMHVSFLRKTKRHVLPFSFRLREEGKMRDAFVARAKMPTLFCAHAGGHRTRYVGIWVRNARCVNATE